MFFVKRFNYAPQACVITLVGANFKSLGPFLSV